MQVVCTDGTTIQCNDFEAIDSGVLLYQESGRRETRDDEADEESERRAAGFVPITELRFVVPDELLGTTGQAQRAPAPEAAPSGAPPVPGTPAGGMAQRQQAQQRQTQQPRSQQFPGDQSGGPYDAGSQ